MKKSVTRIATDEFAGPLSRLGALVSDTLVIIGLLCLGSLLFIPLLTRLNAKAMLPSEVGWAWYGVYLCWLLLIWFGFVGYFWTRTGQTVGMKAWRIQVQSLSGVLLVWPHTIKRLACAILPWLPGLAILTIAEHYRSVSSKYIGLGMLLLGIADWVMMGFDHQNRTWHDRISLSHVKRLPKL